MSFFPKDRPALRSFFILAITRTIASRATRRWSPHPVPGYRFPPSEFRNDEQPDRAGQDKNSRRGSNWLLKLPIGTEQLVT
ncbi:uncharacterized protein EI90DRAFT_3028879 [Cantharellus anzutake]|uniref:uncharacterized protein n=1 Tax=Cantharellus anzutake TaxID=1750568 RepID=UPI00190818AB|nr:uncharacterized protein EI90DRAFT_3028879 [Cantharellus anzutake]KAF8344232.1 hypothetical protein EI90DRAFT_3028879 [Cantharellus anzutake]